MEFVLPTPSVIVSVILISLLASWVGVKGSSRVVRRRVAALEDDLIHLTDRFDRMQRTRAGVSSAEQRVANMQQAALIAAQVKQGQTLDVLPGRRVLNARQN